MGIFGKKKKGPVRGPMTGTGMGSGTRPGVTPIPATPSQPIAEPPPLLEDVGEAVLSRLVSIDKSDNRIIPENKLFAPGDPLQLYVRAITEHGYPVPGLPVKWVVFATKKEIGKGTTGKDGTAYADYVVTEEEMIGDPTSPESDSGSYYVNAYVGGRMLKKLSYIYDTW